MDQTMNKTLLAAFTLMLAVQSVSAQRNLKDVPSPDPAIEKASFRLADGFEINLFAADPLVRKPVQMAFDPEGRLWVSSPTMYPQIRPGDPENDRIVVIEDKDGDGTSDSVRIFAEGLMMPTGVLPGDGGVYVAHGNEIIHLSDTNGDGRSDRRKVVLDGFGTEDTHHVIHSLRWGPDGLMYFHQSYYIASHIETQFGVRRMNGGGIWQFDTQTGRLEPYIHGLVNSWGHRFNRYGASFATDGAGGEGINYIFPGAMMLASPHSVRVLRGLNPGMPKNAGLEILSGRGIPDAWQGRMISADFRANRINSYEISEDGSGYASVKKEDLIQSTHVSFRPIDMMLGPDGAIYVADWYSPIIQHGEVDFKDERRDRVHGRIWRITAQGRPALPRPHTIKEPDDKKRLFGPLESDEQWSRERARRLIAEIQHGGSKMTGLLDRWVAEQETADDSLLLEYLWTYQTLRTDRPALLRRLLKSADHNVRAAAVRVLSQSLSRMPDGMSLLSVLVADEHPRVRLEAVRALAGLRSTEAAVVALRALDLPTDRFLDFAIWRTTWELADVWLPALEAGETDFDGDVSHLTFALQAAADRTNLNSGDSSKSVASRLLDLIFTDTMNRQQRNNSSRVVAALATPAELQKVLTHAVSVETKPTLRSMCVSLLLHAAESRRLRPDSIEGSLKTIAESRGGKLTEVVLLAGYWKDVSWYPLLAELARGEDEETALAAIRSIGLLGRDDDESLLSQLAAESLSPSRRMASVAALVGVDPDRAAESARTLFVELPTATDVTPVFGAFLDHSRGPQALTKLLKGTRIPPDFARLGIRAARSSAIDHSELIDAITASGDIQPRQWNLSGSEYAQLVKDVSIHGDAVRGESVFRRRQLSCLKCHAIAGAGGRVAPDLVSVGASAPVDYLVDSLLDPNKKIKENYQSLVVATDEGKVHNGIRVSQSERELILRSAEDVEVSIPVDTIEFQKPGVSLMPAGLVDNLTRQELLDLVKFLSQLGRVGDFAVGPQRYVRRWQVSPTTGGVATQNRQPIYSRVDGVLPFADSGLSAGVLQFEVEVTTPGRIAFRLEIPGNAVVKVDGQPVEGQNNLSIDATRGRHTVQIVIRDSEAEVRVEMINIPGSPAQARLIGGK